MSIAAKLGAMHLKFSPTSKSIENFDQQAATLRSTAAHRKAVVVTTATAVPPPQDVHRRRTVLALLSAAAVLTNPPSIHAADAAEQQQQQRQEPKSDTTFIQYNSPSQGYSLQRPASWEESSKAGADVIFLNPAKKSSTLGVTVFPVTIPSLEKFGSLDAVGEKLLGAERAKESTLGVTMLSQSQRGTPFGTVYDFQYELESTRGRKRIANCVTIVNSKLYIVNGNVSCGKEECGADAQGEAEMVQRAAQSLQVN